MEDDGYENHSFSSASTTTSKSTTTSVISNLMGSGRDRDNEDDDDSRSYHHESTTSKSQMNQNSNNRSGHRRRMAGGGGLLETDESNNNTNTMNNKFLPPRRRIDQVSVDDDDDDLNNREIMEKEDPLLWRYNNETTTTTRQSPWTNNTNNKRNKKQQPRKWIFHIFTTVIFVASLASIFQVVYFHVEFLPMISSSSTRLFVDSHQHEQQEQQDWRNIMMTTTTRNRTANYTTTKIQSDGNTTNNNTNSKTQAATTVRMVESTDGRTSLSSETQTIKQQQQQPGEAVEQQPSNTIAANESGTIPNDDDHEQQQNDEEERNEDNNDPILLPGISSELASFLQSNPLYQNLRRAIGTSILKNHTEILQDIPQLWENLHRLYYDDSNGTVATPIVVGMETCAQYREKVPFERRYTGVAGLFNTGTNAMEFHLRVNLQLPNRWQVPWGKHRPAEVRKKHVADFMEDANQDDVLPIIMVRDPLFWMQSMCKNSYAALWKHTHKHCPNLVPTADDLVTLQGVRDPATTEHSFPVHVHYPEYVLHWNSLAHLYSEFHNQYLHADYPRLFVRFEDILVNAPAVLAKIAECAGATLAPKFTWQIKSSKLHGSGTNFVKAIWKTGDRSGRVKSMTPADLEYARRHLDEHLLELFHYHLPDDLAVEKGSDTRKTNNNNHNETTGKTIQ